MTVLPLLALLASHSDDTDRLVQDRMRKSHVPGLALAIVKDGKVVKLKGYGLADREKRIAVTPDTSFQLASVTKQFVAAGVMLLVQDGKLSVDDPVAKYVAGTPETWRSVTLRHLLTHTSGIRDYMNESLMPLDKDTTPEKIVQVAAAAPMAFAPGERWSYSNTNYVLLAMVINKVTGEPYDAFLARRVFRPLAMVSTRRSLGAATGYQSAYGPFRLAPTLNPTDWDNGDGGIVSSAADLARWDLALRGNSVLTEESKRQMWTRVPLNDGSTYGYGFGWSVGGTPEHPTLEHGGDRPGVSTYFLRYVKDDLTVIVLTNSEGAATSIARGVASKWIPGLAPDIHPVRLPKGAVEFREGLYWTDRNGLMRLKEEKGTLDAFAGGAVFDAFVPVDGTRLASRESPRGLDFSGKEATITWADGAKSRLVRLGPLPPKARPKAGDLGDGELRAALDRPTPGIAPWIRGGVPELAERASLRVLGSFDLAGQSLVANGTPVTRVVYARMKGSPKYLIAYLTADGRLANLDFLGE